MARREISKLLRVRLAARHHELAAQPPQVGAYTKADKIVNTR